MTSDRWARTGYFEARVFQGSIPLAILTEFVVLTLVGLGQRSSLLSHSAESPSQNSWVEAQIYEMPEAPHLVQKMKAAVPVVQSEIAIHPSASAPQSKATAPAKFDSENQVQEGAPVPRDHGPIPVFNPKPVLPEYLEYQDASHSVVVVFEVSAEGAVNPRLVVSSGHDEIDAVVLETLKRWRFQPGVKDGRPVNSHFRARIDVIPS